MNEQGGVEVAEIAVAIQDCGQREALSMGRDRSELAKASLCPPDQYGVLEKGKQNQEEERIHRSSRRSVISEEVILANLMRGMDTKNLNFGAPSLWMKSTHFGPKNFGVKISKNRATSMFSVAC